MYSQQQYMNNILKSLIQIFLGHETLKSVLKKGVNFL